MTEQLQHALEALIAWLPTCETVSDAECAVSLVHWFTLLISWLMFFIN